MTTTMPRDVAQSATEGTRTVAPADDGGPGSRASADQQPAKIKGLAQAWRDRRQARQGRRDARRHQRQDDRDARRVRRAGSDHADEQDWTRWYPALIGCAVAVVAVTFALSYHGLYEYAETIAHLPTPLPIVVPIGVDVFSLCALVATFLCRSANWRVRAYCWAMFGATVAVSIAGNALYAISDVEARQGSATDVVWGYRQYGAVAGAALWPAFSAGALHLLIVARRHLNAQRATARAVAQQAERDENTEQLNRALAIELVAAGHGCPAIADQLGVPRRTVERWTAEIRSAMSPAPSVRRRS